MSNEKLVAEGVLNALRWKADTQIINHEGEHVWLKQIEGGITDCCYVAEPCERHEGEPI